MSSKNNVNKDFYTIAGRDRPNDLAVEAALKHLPDELPGRRGDARPNFISQTSSKVMPEISVRTSIRRGGSPI